jgi:hypothetical protein
MPHSSPGSSSSRRHRHRHRSLRRRVGDSLVDFWMWMSAAPRRRHHRSRKRGAAGMAAEARMWVSTLPKRHPGIGKVVAADVLITYLYSVAVYALMQPPPPAPPAMDVVAQPLTYVYVAPVAMLAALLGGGQVVQAWAKRPRWWSLTPQAAAIGALAAFLINAPRAVHPLTAPVARAMVVVGALSAVLGVMLTSANYALARALRPRTHRRRRSRSSTAPETPPPAAAAD